MGERIALAHPARGMGRGRQAIGSPDTGPGKSVETGEESNKARREAKRAHAGKQKRGEDTIIGLTRVKETDKERTRPRTSLSNECLKGVGMVESLAAPMKGALIRRTKRMRL